MKSSLIHYLGSLPTLKVVNALINSPTPVHLREIASSYSLSPGGVSDILNRLRHQGLLTERKVGNTKRYSLNINDEERKVLLEFFKIFWRVNANKNTVALNLFASKRLKWMDQARLDYKRIKRETN